MKGLLNFADSALSRVEMKSITGGNCYVQTSTGPVSCPGLSDCKALAKEVHHGHYCCASCGNTVGNWCKGC